MDVVGHDRAGVAGVIELAEGISKSGGDEFDLPVIEANNGIHEPGLGLLLKFANNPARGLDFAPAEVNFAQIGRF